MDKSKPILVTGSKGFIGRRLVLSLRNKGFTVLEFDQIDGNICDYPFKYKDIGHVFHLASQTFVPASWENTYDFYQTNVMGTTNILELCRTHKCSLTYVSSYVYGAPKYLPVDELHPIQPASPYNHSKLVAEEICKYYAETFQIPVAVLRPVNIYGPGQRGEFLIPTIVNQVMNLETTSINVMDVRPKRDYLFIDDFIDALLSTLDVQGFEVFNIGSGYSVSVEEIIKIALTCAGVEKSIQSSMTERKNEIWDVYVDITKFSRRFSWKPIVSIQEGIFRCIKA